MTSFQEKVIAAVKLIPSGKVVSYGQIALFLDMPRGARAVGWALRSLHDLDLPWWRVINNQGRISIKGNWQVDANTQKELLLKEGVSVSDDFKIDIEKYRFQLALR
jgi:methylated-DNA-protein-cysteine methyltransferase-like protein